MNSVLYGDLKHLSKSDNNAELMTFTFREIGFSPSNVKTQQSFPIYDTDHHLEGIAIVQKVDFVGKQMTVLIEKTSLNSLKISKTSHYVISGASIRSYKPWATISIILSLNYLVFYYLNSTITNSLTRFIIAMQQGNHINDYYDSWASTALNGEGEFFSATLDSWAWTLTFLAPIIAFLLIHLHWNAIGEYPTGVIALFFASILTGIAFQTMMLILGGYGLVSAALVESLTTGFLGVAVLGVVSLAVFFTTAREKLTR